MESKRSQKARSLGLHCKTHDSHATPRRPGAGERTKSAPLVPGHHDKPPRNQSISSQSSGSSSLEDQRETQEGSLPHLSAQTTDQESSGLRIPSSIARPLDNPHINLVVLGNSEVGKTSFIKRALDLPTPQKSICSSRVSLGGRIYRIRVVEIDLDDVEIQDEQHVSWPKNVENEPFSSPDAVICLYDVTDADSMLGIPQFLAALANLDTPVLLVAAKTDTPLQEHELGAEIANQVIRTFPHVLMGETSIASEEKPKKCLLMILKAVLHSLFGMKRVPVMDSSPIASRSGAVSPHMPRSSNKAGSDQDNTHGARLRDGEQESEDEDDQVSDNASDEEFNGSNKGKSSLTLQTRDLTPNPNGPNGPQTPISDTGPYTTNVLSPSAVTNPVVPQTPESYHHANLTRPGTAGTADSRAHHTFLNIDDESPTTSTHPDQSLLEQLQVHGRLRSDGGVSFADLVDKLLQLPTSKGESKFVPSFLCLYRGFATPTRLLVEIVDRFVTTEKSEQVQFAKVAELLRYLQVMAQWTATYPGDFAGSVVRELATTFVQGIEHSKNFAHAAKEISNNLQVFVEDEDSDWAYDDLPSSDVDCSGNKPAMVHKATGTDNPDQSIDSDDSDSEDGNTDHRSPPNSGTASTASSILLKTSIHSSQSASNLVALESARHQARKMKLNPHIPLGKAQWHFFMETPNEDIARVITKIDWTLFSSIRPRDFVRHVTITTLQKRQLKQDNLSAMAKQFDHLAFFTSGMILLRDKPKHRAKALEKLMDLSWKIRRMNNYNSLGAIVAGITGSEITRLVQTIELIPPETRKQFQRLITLMSTPGAWATYRMAWENSFNERIPYFTVIQRDITLAAGANQTFIRGNINWKKFEIMGDMIVGLQRCHEHPYTFPKSTSKSYEIMKLILETKIVGADDSADPRNELHTRSLQVEPHFSNEGKKKFDWLRR